MPLPPLLALLLPAALASPAAAETRFIALDAPGSQLMALSADGRIAAGTVSGGPSGGFRWREGKRIEFLDGAVSVHGLSPSGNTVAGSAFDGQQREVAGYWDEAGRLRTLESLPGGIAQHGVLSKALGALDGPRIVGVANDARDHMVAVVWEGNREPHPLALPSSDADARAQGLGADGALVYGGYRQGEGRYQAMTWRGENYSVLAAADGSPAGEVLGASRNADVILGTLDGDGGTLPYRKTPQGLHVLAAADDAVPKPLLPLAASDDGRVVVGSAGVGGARVAVVWLADDAPVRLDQLLASRHIAVPPGWTLAAATAISSDGRRIGGWGQHQRRLDSFLIDLGGVQRARRMPDGSRTSTEPERTPRRTAD